MKMLVLNNRFILTTSKEYCQTNHKQIDQYWVFPSDNLIPPKHALNYWYSIHEISFFHSAWYTMDYCVLFFHPNFHDNHLDSLEKIKNNSSLLITHMSLPRQNQNIWNRKRNLQGKFSEDYLTGTLQQLHNPLQFDVLQQLWWIQWSIDELSSRSIPVAHVNSNFSCPVRSASRLNTRLNF